MVNSCKEVFSEVISISIISDMGKIKFVHNAIEIIREDYSLSDDTFANLLVATTEGMTNAILHGNKEDKTLLVLFSCAVNQDNVEVTIKDFGKGFDITSTADSFDQVNSNSPVGRGILLIKALTYKVEFLENGTFLRMVFKK